MIQLTQSTPRTPFIKYLITAGPSSNCLCPSHLAQHVHSNTKITSNCKGEAFVTKQLVESSNIATHTSYLHTNTQLYIILSTIDQLRFQNQLKERRLEKKRQHKCKYQVLKSTSFLPIIAALSNCTYFLL